MGFLGLRVKISWTTLWLCLLHDMPEFAAYFENSFGCNVFFWLNVIYISLFFSLILFFSFSFLMFCFRILKSTQVPQSFLFASALPPPLRSSLLTLSLSLSLHWLRSLCGSLFLWLPSLSVSLSAYTDNGNGSGRSSRSPYSFCVSVSAIALCAHIRCEPKNPKTHNNKRTL